MMGVRISSESLKGRGFATKNKNMQTYSQIHSSNLWCEDYIAAPSDEMVKMRFLLPVGIMNVEIDLNIKWSCAIYVNQLMQSPI